MLMKLLPSENKQSLSTEVLRIREITEIFVFALGETESLKQCFYYKRQEMWLMSTLKTIV